MSYTSIHAHISAEEMIESFAPHCDHNGGSKSFRVTPRGQVIVSAYLTANDPDELIHLAEVLIAAARAWQS
jgi:hypothetical protein